MDQNTYTLHIDFHKQTRTHTHTIISDYVYTYIPMHMSLYLQRHVGDTYHICPQMKVWKGHGLFAVSPPFFGAPISVSPKDSIGACRLRPEEILYGVGFNSRQIKRQLVD